VELDRTGLAGEGEGSDRRRRVMYVPLAGGVVVYDSSWLRVLDVLRRDGRSEQGRSEESLDLHVVLKCAGEG